MVDIKQNYSLEELNSFGFNYSAEFFCEGKTVEECLALKDQFLDLVTQDKEVDSSLGKLKVFEGVKQFPVRVKCAALVWRALEDALEQGSEEHSISTE